MNLLRDILRQYGAKLVAIGVFACAAVKYCRFHDAFDLNRHLELIILAFGGLVMFIASDEWSDWSGGYGLTRQDWISMSPWHIRVVGGIMLVVATLALYGQ